MCSWRLHLGSGARYIEGMHNIDGNLFCKKDLWLDLRNPLPFPSKSAEFVYCSHALEHLYPDEAIHLLAEVYRVLREDGVARVAVPSVEHAIEVAAGRRAEAYPRPFDDPLAQAVNYLFCDGQHKYGYSFGILQAFAREAGFTDIRQCSTEKSEYMGIVVGDEPAGSLVMEFRR